MALLTYPEALQAIKDDWQYIADSKYPEDKSNEYADSSIPIYTAEIQREWVELDFDNQNRWQECFSLSDLGQDKDINYLMTIDLHLYYEALYSRAIQEILAEQEESDAE